MKRTVCDLPLPRAGYLFLILISVIVLPVQATGLGLGRWSWLIRFDKGHTYLEYLVRVTNPGLSDFDCARFQLYRNPIASKSIPKKVTSLVQAGWRNTTEYDIHLKYDAGLTRYDCCLDGQFSQCTIVNSQPDYLSFHEQLWRYLPEELGKVHSMLNVLWDITARPLTPYSPATRLSTQVYGFSELQTAFPLGYCMMETYCYSEKGEDFVVIPSLMFGKEAATTWTLISLADTPDEAGAMSLWRMGKSFAVVSRRINGQTLILFPHLWFLQFRFIRDNYKNCPDIYHPGRWDWGNLDNQVNQFPISETKIPH